MKNNDHVSEHAKLTSASFRSLTVSLVLSWLLNVAAQLRGEMGEGAALLREGRAIAKDGA
jgi:hypothetical protein